MAVHEKYKKYLPTTLQSLSNQIKNCEVIIENGDGKKLARVCNDAIKKAQGDYIVRVDSDDWIEPELIKAESEYLDSHKEVDCVWCDYLKTEIRHKGNGWETFEVEHYPQPVLEHACGAMYRKTVWETLGGYDETLDFQESFDFWMRFKKRFNAHHLPIPMYYYRQHPGSMSTSSEREQVRKYLEEKYRS